MSRSTRSKGSRRAVVSAVVGLAVLLLPATGLAGTAPTVVGATSNSTTLSGAISVAVSGTHAYATAYWPGQLTSVDISNPSSPQIVGSTTTNATALENGSNVAIAGHYAFVVSKNRNADMSSNDDGSGNSLTIVDVSTPTNAVVVGTVHSSTQLFGAYGVAVQGNYAYVAYQGILAGQPTSPGTSTGGVSVIDITNPGGPTIVANLDNGSLPAPWTSTNALQHATSVAISGRYAYVNAFYADRLTVLDISVPTSPRIIASVADATNLHAPADLAVQGNYVYVANQNTGLTTHEFTVINVANPARPSIQATVTDSMLSSAYRLRVRGDFAYVAAIGSGAVSAIDISDPTHPRLAGAVQDAGHLHSVSGLDLDPSGRYVIASSPLMATENKPIYPPFPGQSGGPVNTGTISVIDMVPNAIAVTIAPSSKPANPSFSGSAGFSFSTDDDVSAVQCALDGAAPGPCTSPTSQSYSGLTAGSHTFVVRATDSSGHTASAGDTWVVAAPPRSAAAPKVSGKPLAGALLSTDGGRWTGYPAPALSYQWQRCGARLTRCSNIAKATGTHYRLQGVDIGTRLRVVVRALSSAGSALGRSSATKAVVNFASGSLGGVLAGRPRLTLTAVAAPGLSIRSIRVGLPVGLTYTRSVKLSRLASVRNGRGKPLAFTARLVRGALVISLRHATGIVHVVLTGLSASRTLIARIAHHRARTVALRLIATETRRVRVSATTRIRAG